MALFPTKKISALSPVTLPLTGFEEFECVQLGNSRKATSRDFVLPTDSLLTFSAMGGSLPGSRQMTAGIGIAFVDGGPGSTLSINATGAVAGPANPTAFVGLAAVNGAALTYMRSDAAPALDQSISPTWTGNHIFAANQNQVRNAAPQWIFVETDAAADNQAWPIRISGEQFTIGALNDLGSVFTPWVTVDRTGTTIDLVNLQGTTVSVNGQNIRDAAILTSGLVGTARLGGGVADATTWLRGDQTWQSLPGGFTGFANPTATLGLAAINGAATTAMRSDAAPALSQAIAPTWTAQHIFGLSGATNAAILVSSAQPQTDYNESDAAANNRRWRWEAQGEQFLGRTVNDANSAAVTWLAVDRTLNVVDTIALTSTALTWNGNPLLSTATAFANPTGTVGLAAVNGVATTAMRSDAAPPLSQAIAPTWTAQHIFSLVGSGTAFPVAIRNSLPGWALRETDAAANNQDWIFYAQGEQLAFQACDSTGFGGSWLSVDRTGTTIDLIVLRSSRVDITNPTAAAPIDLFLNDANAAANERLWRFRANAAGQLQFGAVNDALSAATNWVQVDRTGSNIDSVAFPVNTGGAFLVGTATSLLGSVQAHFLAPASSNALLAKAVTAIAGSMVAWNSATAGDNNFVEFGTEAAYTPRGSITFNRGAGLTAYNTTSDVRRKKNIRDSEDAGTLIDRIKVRAFDWSDSDNHVEHWVVAQELHAVMPMAVTEGDDTRGRDWAVDISKLVPLLVKEVQSMRRRLVALETPGNIPRNN
jgi:hypothetical protein